MGSEVTDFRVYLQNELTRRLGKNPKYSLRAFAKSLQVDSGSLSQMLSGKRAITRSNTIRIGQRLGLGPHEIERFTSAQEQKKRGRQNNFRDSHQQLTVDTFQTIADWYHYAILNLVEIKGFESSPRWISQKLGISQTEANLAIQRLKRLDLIREEDGSYIRTSKQLKFDRIGNDGIATAAIRRFHKQALDKAVDSLEGDPIDERDITSITMPVDPSKLEQARRLIKKFRRDMWRLMEGGDPSRVYNLCVQLYPISEDCTKPLSASDEQDKIWSENQIIGRGNPGEPNVSVHEGSDLK